jgi:CheY-like chemotaxis protein
MKTLLLADDNKDMVELVKLVLSNSGYNIITVADGKDAVHTCLEINPDMVIMDIKMPNMDGLTASSTLRAKGYVKPIIILTASEREQDRESAKKCGCNGYILKTMDMAEVEPIVDKYLAEAGHGLE